MSATKDCHADYPLQHLAVIPDGNRRWACRHGFSMLDGYQRGGERILDLLKWCEDIAELETVTLWPLSIENLHRPRPELDALFVVIVDTIAKIAATGRWHIRLLGDLNRLPQDIRSRLLITVEQTLDITDSTVNIAIAYSGRDEITRGIRKLLMARRAAGTLDHMARYVTPDDVNTYLDTAGQSDPDLVIRTAGEKRLSGFLPWQTVYTELYFTDILWPDFTPSDLTIAMQDYSRRIRREGR